jgi:6-phosphogluconolactonase
MSEIETFESRTAASGAVAKAIAAALRASVEENGEAAFAATGGSSPAEAYRILSTDTSVPWENVQVTLTDERRAPESANADNASLVRGTLLKGPARFAHFQPLTGPAALRGFPERFAVTLLGMGSDGHIASIFPKGDGVEAALAPDAPRVLPTTPDPLPPEAPFSRWTLSLPALKSTDLVVLLMFGDEKKAVFEQALQGMGGDAPLPVTHILGEQPFERRIFWAP